MKKKKNQYYLTDRNPKMQFFLSFVLLAFFIGFAIPAFVSGAIIAGLMLIGASVYIFFEFTLSNYKAWKQKDNKEE
jgi:hypothetical protein